jgi:V/A-type H+-transporting ATPase subunit D
MELLRLRKRLALARRGHKLLQDKLEGLIKEFMPIIGEYVVLREEVDQKVPAVFSMFAKAAAQGDESAHVASLAQTGFSASVDLSEEKRGSVFVPVLKAQYEKARPFYSMLSTPHELDGAVKALADLLPLVLKTVEREEAVRRLAAEIERTRRRVNALEYIMIPKLKQAGKSIQAKLDEDERAARVRNMKVKEILERAAKAAQQAK